MEMPDRWSSYKRLLNIRQSAQKRDTRIIGSIFLLSLLSTLGFGLVTGLGDREVYLVAALNIVFGVVFIMAWVRLEILNSAIELIDNIQD